MVEALAYNQRNNKRNKQRNQSTFFLNPLTMIMEAQQIEKVHKHRGNQTMQHIKEPRLDSMGASRTRLGHTWCCDGLWLIELLRPSGCLQQFLSHMARVRLVARNCKTNIYGWYMDSTSNVPWVTNQQARPRVFFFCLRNAPLKCCLLISLGQLQERLRYIWGHWYVSSFSFYIWTWRWTWKSALINSLLLSGTVARRVFF